MISYLANPQRFLKFSRYAVPLFSILFIGFLLVGLWHGLINSPPAEDHGDGVRIMYVHVPAAWLSMFSYLALFIASFVSFVWRHNLADYGARAFARLGLVFTGLCLVTGAIWGKTSWGTWWDWDPRMTSVLILFFIYAAYLLIWVIVEDHKRAARLASIFAMVGMVNIPIIKFSVDWSRSLHQKATISNIGAPGLDNVLAAPLAFMTLSYMCLFAWLSMVQVRTDIHTAQSKRKPSQSSANIKIEEL